MSTDSILKNVGTIAVEITDRLSQLTGLMQNALSEEIADKIFKKVSDTLGRDIASACWNEIDWDEVKW